MKAADIDWIFLRRTLIGFGLSVVVSGGLVGAAQLFSADSSQRLQERERRLQSVRGQFLRLDEERETIELFFPRYEALADAGLIGGERRLNWIESLRAASDAAGIVTLRYEIAAQSVFVPDVPVPRGRYGVYASEMHLDLGLFHEGDLRRFLDELQRRARGLYSVRECHLERAEQSFSAEPATVNLRADCRLHWYTVRLPGAQGNAG